MNNSADLREQRKAKIDEANATVDAAKSDERDLTADEESAIDSLLSDADGLNDDISMADSRESRAVRLENATASLDDVPSTQRTEPGTKPIVRDSEPRISQPGVRLRNFAGDNAELRAHCAGMWIKAAMLGDGDARDWCNNNSHMELRVMTGANNQAGGATVPSDFSDTIINLKESFGVFAREANVIDMTRDVMTIPRRTAGVTGYWVNETDSITASDATFNQVNLTARKLASLTRVSNDLLEDSAVNIGDFLAGEIAFAFASEEDDAGFNGTGASTYGGISGVTGIFDANEAYNGVYTAASGNDTFGEITVADLTGAMGRLPEYAYANAKWFVSQTGFGSMMERLAHTAGGETSQTITQGITRSYFGYPVVISQKLQTSTSDLSEKTMALFGSLNQACTFGRRRDITLVADASRYLENDQTAFRATERIDIVFHEAGDSSTSGAIVGLMGD